MRIGQLGRIGHHEGVERSRRGQRPDGLDLDVEPLDRPGLGDVERLASRPRLVRLHEHDPPRQLLLGDPAGERGGEVPRPQDRDGMQDARDSSTRPPSAAGRC